MAIFNSSKSVVSKLSILNIGPYETRPYGHHIPHGHICLMVYTFPKDFNQCMDHIILMVLIMKTLQMRIMNLIHHMEGIFLMDHMDTIFLMDYMDIIFLLVLIMNPMDNIHHMDHIHPTDHIHHMDLKTKILQMNLQSHLTLIINLKVFHMVHLDLTGNIHIGIMAHLAIIFHMDHLHMDLIGENY
jgi:hypothetical protein